MAQNLSARLLRLFNHQGLRRYLANMSWRFLEQMLRIVAALFVGIYVARYLGPENFGTYSYVIAFVSLFSVLPRLGLDDIVVRDLVHRPEQQNLILGTAFFLKLVASFATIALLLLVLGFSANSWQVKGYMLIIAAGLVFQSADVIDFYFQAKVLAKYTALCRITQLALSSLVKLYLIYLRADLFWFVLVVLFDQITLTSAQLYSFYQQRVGRFWQQWDLSLAAAMLRSAWPLVIAGISVVIYMKIDQVLITSMLGVREAGLYSAAVRLSEVFYIIPGVVVASVLPSIVYAKKTDSGLYYRRLRNLSVLMSWLAIAIAMTMSVLAPWVVNLLYGEAFAESATVLAVHVWASVFIFFGYASNVYFTLENRTSRTLYRTVIGAVASVLLNYILIPRFGIVGAAVTTVLSQFTVNYLCDFFDPSVRDQLFAKTKTILLPLSIFR